MDFKTYGVIAFPDVTSFDNILLKERSGSLGRVLDSRPLDLTGVTVLCP